MKDTSVKIIEKLRNNGFEAYWAGGTVRDFLLGKNPKDYDIATSARPEQIEKILEKTIPVGKKFGVILAMMNGHHYEVATFRSDSAYTDGRRPDAVYFKNAKEDALRRDFTINGMFYDPIEKKLLDYVGGKKDLEEKVLRFIGDPKERIQEDNLRLLRAIRFKNALGLSYAPGTFETIKENAKLIENISKERIRDELSKILLLPGRENAFLDLEKAGFLEILIPEICKLKGVRQPEKYHKEGDVFNHVLFSLEALPDKASERLVWATLLHDIGKSATFSVSDRIRFNEHSSVGGEITAQIADRFRFSNQLKSEVVWLVKHHMMLGDIPRMTTTRQRHWFSHPLFADLLELLRADSLGSKTNDLDLYWEIKGLMKKCKTIKKEPPLISGKDLLDLGLKPGPQVGQILNEVENARLDEKIKTKKEALDYARKLL